MILNRPTGFIFVICFLLIGVQGLFADTSSGKDLLKLNSELQHALSESDTAKSRLIFESLQRVISVNGNDDLEVSTSHYLIGVYYLMKEQNNDAIRWLRSSASLRQQTLSENDETLAKCFFNLGIAYSKIGDFSQMEQAITKSLEIEKSLYGESDPRLIRGLSAMVNACFGLADYEQAIVYGTAALKLSDGSDKNYSSDMTLLYSNLGACYSRLSDYSKAILYFEKAEAMFEKYNLPKDDYYVNLLNSLAANYFFLGMNDKADYYFRSGLERIGSSKSDLSLNFLNSFAVILGNAGRLSEGEVILIDALKKAGENYGKNSRNYIEVLKNYAEYLRTYRIDIRKSLSLYEQCLNYVDSHREDNPLKEAVIVGYALGLAETGEQEKGLTLIQQHFFPGFPSGMTSPSLENPDLSSIETVPGSLVVLRAKYTILWDLYIKKADIDYLFAASRTSELIISLIEKIRINISEEDSRILLGEKYRDSYLFAIRDFDLCFKKTGDISFLYKAFTYAEKSKVAGLLASTRELKATQLHIPSEIAEMERSLKSQISFYEAKISAENARNKPDSLLLAEWKEIVLQAVQKMDSLTSRLEKEYPGYFILKYNTEVIRPDEISRITGRNSNYLNYVVSDSVLYIFLVNRRNFRLASVPVDSAFFSGVSEFRNFISSPGQDAYADFARFNAIGRLLYSIVFEPVKEYLVSDQLLISPDNVLSYLPFDVIPLSSDPKNGQVFNRIEYVMNRFNVSYTYSATLLAESASKEYRFSNRLAAFAPVYTGRIDIDSLLGTRQGGNNILGDLQFARTEAEYVTQITGGNLFINNGAKESVFKSKASEYDIIHLAMHTVLNDKDPMYSKMLFYQGDDPGEDGNLNTYEVYGIPLRAKMVILSSCNTGTGMLHSGEGILSLARGFVYAGSRAVVMSMWEIEDQSGAEIVKDYYRNLMKGASKSQALRKARISYLKRSDMLRSHPYFWASMVIYGNNDPVFYKRKILALTGIVLILIITGIGFFYRRSR